MKKLKKYKSEDIPTHHSVQIEIQEMLTMNMITLKGWVYPLLQFDAINTSTNVINRFSKQLKQSVYYSLSQQELYSNDFFIMDIHISPNTLYTARRAYMNVDISIYKKDNTKDNDLSILEGIITSTIELILKNEFLIITKDKQKNVLPY